VKRHLPRAALFAGALTVLGLVGGRLPAGAQSQKPEEGSRQIWDEEFVQARPKAPRAAASARPPATTRPAGKAAATGSSFVGVTLWRLSPAPEGSRAVTVAGEGRRWLPERAEVDAAIPEGQQVRIAVEASRPGYLYVIDRERYQDGSLGEPVLVFPTRRIRGGDNAVQAGRVIEIPDLGDQPPYLTLKRSRPDHTADQLILLVAQEPLAGVDVGREAQALTRAQVDEWLRRWGTGHRKLEMVGGAGRGYTASEQEAAAQPSRLLTRGEPLPQTLYRIEGTAGDPALVVVTLRIAPR
jgi:hypothetical protein